MDIDIGIAASQPVAAVTRQAPRRRSASPHKAQCLAFLVRDGGPALSGDGITRADAALPTAQDAAPGAALGPPEQDEPCCRPRPRPRGSIGSWLGWRSEG